MSELTLAPETYVVPSPAGAYYAASNRSQEPARALLFRLMSLGQTPILTTDLLRSWLGDQQVHTGLELLWHMQSLGWIQGARQARPAPAGALDEILLGMLAELSSEKKALLADDSGFYVANYGYTHEAAEELSALSGRLASLYERHRGLLYNNLGIPSAAWAVVDAAGNSTIGFWPLYIGVERFVLAISGMPQLSQPAFVDLVWALARRYADVPEVAPDATVVPVHGT